MKLPLFVNRSGLASIALLAILSAGCATSGSKPSTCPPKYSYHYEDAARGFRLCLPTGLTKTVSGATTTFTGFAVPAGTNLQAKTLIVATGNYDLLQGANSPSTFTANGVALHRVLADEGSAGHSTLHVIYTWKKNGHSVHFDFTHRAVNVGNFDPPNRPQEYNQAAQIKLTEEIMSTFKPL
jgi:hypothetical protein